MEIQFYKYQAAGNDFVIIDDRANQFDVSNHELVQLLCNRRFGIGADGLMLFKNSTEVDFEMVYFNADGYEGSLCGNGGRAIVKFGVDQGIIGNKVLFNAFDGPHHAEVKENGWVRLEMNDVKEVEKGEDYFWLDTGSPHYVCFVNDIQNLNVVEQGAAIRYNERFKSQGTNVNFVKSQSNTELVVRTYERGVENETLSCGTGVTASAIAHAIKGGQSPVKVQTLGGTLEVEFTQENGGFTNLFLSGPAKQVFAGTFKIQ